MSETVPDNGPVLFFDGVCNLCNEAVQFVIRHDRRGRVRFAALQSTPGQEAAAAVRQQYGRLPDSLILLEHGKYYMESAAALRLAGHLDGGYRLLKGFLAVPGFIRNAVYRFIARRRYKWFGRQAACLLPSPELQARFLQDHPAPAAQAL